MILAGMLMMLLSALVPAAIITSAITLVTWTRRRTLVKRAGVGPDNPGCTQCLYLVRGWESSTCPECGADASFAGVCIGTRVHLALKLLTAACVAALLAIAIGRPLVEWLFLSRDSLAIQRVTDAGGRFDVDVRAIEIVRRMAGGSDRRFAITVAPKGAFGDLTTGFMGWNWQPISVRWGHDSARWRTIEIGRGESTPAPDEIAAMIAQVIGGEITPEIQQQAHWLAIQSSAMHTKSPPSVALATPPAMFLSASGGSAGAVRLTSGGSVFFLVLVMALPLIAAAVTWRLHGPGWRPAIDGEWLRTGGSDRP